MHVSFQESLLTSVFLIKMPPKFNSRYVERGDLSTSRESERVCMTAEELYIYFIYVFKNSLDN